MKDYVSVAVYAKKHNISVQTVYNYIKENKLDFITFERGKTTGYLIKDI